MQQWWFDDSLGLKTLIYGVFYDFALILRFSLIFMNIKSNLHRWPWDYRHMSNLQMVPRLVVYDKYQL